MSTMGRGKARVIAPDIQPKAVHAPYECNGKIRLQDQVQVLVADDD